MIFKMDHIKMKFLEEMQSQIPVQKQFSKARILPLEMYNQTGNLTYQSRSGSKMMYFPGILNEIPLSFLLLQFFYSPMLLTDQLIEVLETSPKPINNVIIRKTNFDVTVNGQLYLDTCSTLSETSVVFRLKIADSFMFVRVKFSFDLLFQVEETTNEEKIKEVKSIILQRANNKLAVGGSKNVKQLLVWRDFFQKNLNQRGFHQKYSAIKKIGKGNFATVYLINKIEDNSKYAAKSFSKELLYAQEKGKQSLINEISLMRKFNHKNLIKLEGVYETDHSIYLVLELLQGGLLSQKISRKQKIGTLQIKVIMKSLLEGLEAMHKKSIMHRDLKPQNILLRRQGECQCVIADFGLAEMADSQEYLFVRCGTPGFVAPEVVNIKQSAAKYTCACDLFSLGIIFHMLLLKKSPFTSKEYNQTLAQNRACSFNFESFQYRQLTQTSLNLLQRLLQKDPKKRITASEALKHAFFYSQFTIWEKKYPLPSQRDLNATQEISMKTTQEYQLNLSMERNPRRKKMTHIRGDSCLLFKTKENIIVRKTCSEEQSKENMTGHQANHSILKKGFSKFKRQG